jgi:hypothetical protein
MAVPYTFGSATTSIPLSQLDSNFATTITLGNTAIQLGNTVTTLNNITMANVTVSSAATPIPEAAGGTGSNSGWNDFKNRIINGAMALDQRNAGASQTITAAAALAYTVDRWYAYCTGANVTGQQIAGAYTSSQYRYQFTGAASVTAIGFGQRIEVKNCFDLANTTATLSCYISNSLLTTVTWTAYYATTTADTFGSLASPTVTQIATGTFTVSNTRTQYTTNISIPSAATTGIQILFTVGAQTSGTWIIDSVQLEKGSTATSFDYRPYGTELALCQRYFCKTFPLGTAPGNDVTIAGAFRGTAVTINTLSQIEPAGTWKFPVSMRTTPGTITLYSPGTSGHTAGQWTNDGNAGSSANARTNFAGTESTSFDNTAVLLAAGFRAIIHATADAEL